MGYFDFGNFDENKNKIPYDDIPISRNERVMKTRGSSGSGGGGWGRSNVILSVFIAINFILSLVCVYFIKNTKNRTINQYIIQMGSSTEVSSAVKTSAYLNSVCVAAGGSCSSNAAFYNSTLSRGSGIIYKVSGNTIYFVTCYHVVSGYEDKVWVMLPTAVNPISVSVVAFSSHYDLAVLKYVTADVEYTLGGASPISVFNSTYVSLGEKVFAIGNSLSCGLSITDGVISQINAEIRISSNDYTTRTIQTSAEINPGNSGGGLFNGSGKFIGLINAKRHSATSGTETFTVVGTSYAIPSSLVCGIADKLIKNQTKPTYVKLGVTFNVDDDFGKTISLVEYDGEYRQVEEYSVVVQSVQAGSPAYQKLRAGSDDVRDVIESFEIEMYDIFRERNDGGTTVTKRIKMYNKFSFEDYQFAIVEGSNIRFYLKDSHEVSETYVDVVASSMATVSD